MNESERIIEVQRLTQDYHRTAELLDLSYGLVRMVCEEE